MRRRPGGGRASSVMNRGILLRRLETCQNKYSTTDQIVDYLRSNYPDYGRCQQQPFTKFVQKTLDSSYGSIKKHVKSSSAHSSKFEFDEDDDDDERGDRRKYRRDRKKRKKIEESEVTESSSKEEDEEEEDGVSTSEDAIYEEKVEPEFDLMKSMLRATYVESKNVKPKTEEKNIELEVTSNREDRNKVDMVNNDGGEKRLGSNLKSEDVKGKDGPRFRDLGGMKQVLDELKMEVLVPLYHPQLPLRLGVKPVAGILLHGPPGCGKTRLAHAIGNETSVPFYMISATEVVSGVSGASEENIRELFSKACRTAPSIIFIDEIDAIASKRENLQREMERRIVTQLLTCMDASHRLVQTADKDADSDSDSRRPGFVLVIGATNRPDAVDSALRRPGRFDREIVLGVPDEKARTEILSVVTRNLRLEGSFDLLKIARSTPGFVGADLEALANKAGNLAMKRSIDKRKCDLCGENPDEEQTEDWWKQPWTPEEIESLSITMADFEEAAKLVQPSSRREGFSSIPNVKWEDVGGLDILREDFDRYIVRRIKYPEDYEGYGVDLETGFLLYGPPGCGKTLIAKAVANEAGANFIHIKGPELLNKYVGESELAVRTLFSRARTCSPCILFFDEVDALTTTRGREGGWVVERLLNQLLIELDGADQRPGVFVIGATNRPEVMDRAVLRPGRFGKLLYVPLPSPSERGLILKAVGRKKPIDANVDLCAIGQLEACENLSGADLAHLMNEAALLALEERRKLSASSLDTTPRTIKTTHFEQALGTISPSVSNQQKQHYKILSQTLSQSFCAA